MAGGTWTRYFPKKKERAPISYLDSGRRAMGYHETVRSGGTTATAQPIEIISASSKYGKLRDKARSSKKLKATWIRSKGLG